MMHKSHSLHYDFIDHNGYYLVISSREEGLKESDLNKIQVNMLQSNTVPRLLPMDIEERDFNIRLYYEVGNRRTLRNMCRSSKIRLDEFLQMLLNILGLLEDSSNYMLDERSYILDAELIFIGRDYSDVFLTYVPLVDTKDKKTVYEDLRLLINEIGDQVEDPAGNTLQVLRNYFRDEKDSFSISSLKQTVITLMNRTGLLQAAAAKQQVQQIKPVESNQGVQQAAAAREHAVQAPRLPKPPAGNTPAPITYEKVSNKNITSEKQPVEVSERTKVITACAALLLTAFIWKTYMDYPGEGALYLSVGLSILVWDAVFIILKVWKPGKTAVVESKDVPKPVSKKEKAKISPAKEKIENLPKKEKKNKKQKQPQVVAQPPVELPKPQPAAEINEQQYYRELENKTTFLNESNDTAMLKETNTAAAEETGLLMPKPCLEITRDGKTETIEIRGPRFIIGRKAAVVDYVEEDKHVGRVHLEVLQIEGGWAIKDLESKNYSYKNGERLVPNKIYPVNDGDKIKLATVEYTFKMRPL